MKKIWTMSALLFAFALFFSCSGEDMGKDTDDIIKNGTFTPVTLRLSSVMGVQIAGENADGFETKAGEAADAYTSDVLFLMVEDGTQPEGWKAYPISLITDGNTVGFDFSVSTVDSETTRFQNGNNPAVEIGATTRLFFSSTSELTVRTDLDPTKLTPNGNETLKPYGEKLFKSDYLYITPIENGVRVFGQNITAEYNGPIKLVMYRMTGWLKANLILFKKNENTPEGVTNNDLSPSKWFVTPYLNNYTDMLQLDSDVTGPAAGAYMLSTGGLTFATREVTGISQNGKSFTINTYVAEDTGYFPYIFSGKLTGTAIEFVIATQQPPVKLLIAEIWLADTGQLLCNDRRTINVFMNVTKLNNGNCDGEHDCEHDDCAPDNEDTDSSINIIPELKAALLTGNEEVLPDIFYCWE